jgi:hypothetical protein
MRPTSDHSEGSVSDDAHQLALVMFNTFRMDFEKRNLALLDMAEEMFRLAFELQAASADDAAERLQRMISLARLATERFERAA